MNIKETFLKLTDYTVPFGHEKTLEPILFDIVPDLKKDDFGNYYIEIGESRTLFTSHLDTYSIRREKVNHVIKKNNIKTDGTTVLGGDNKNGVVILLYMITEKVPGTYYFFLGEEGVVTGTSCNGSTWLLKNTPDLGERFDRAIAFDRRGKGSVVTKQRARHCCSDDFSNAIVEQFGEQEMKFSQDYAYGTDSAVFMDVIPEITNLSSGGSYEHSYLESTDINYTKRVAFAATIINWESLPVSRKISPSVVERTINTENETYKQSKETFDKVEAILSVKGFLCINKNEFDAGRVMKFEKYVKDHIVMLSVMGDTIHVVNDVDNCLNKFNDDSIGSLIFHLGIEEEDLFKKVIGGVVRKMGVEYTVSIKEMGEITNEYLVTFKDFKEYIEKSTDYNKYFKFDVDKVYMDIIAGQGATIKKQREQEAMIA